MTLEAKRRAMKMLAARMRSERGSKAVPPAAKPAAGVTITITPGIVSPTDDMDHDAMHEPDDDEDD